MFRFRFNPLGLGLLVLSAIIVAIGTFVLRLQDQRVMILAGSVLLAIDMLIRLRHMRSEPRWAIRPDLGGHLFSLPIWGVGLILIVANTYVLLSGGR